MLLLEELRRRGQVGCDGCATSALRRRRLLAGVGAMHGTWAVEGRQDVELSVREGRLKHRSTVFLFERRGSDTCAYRDCAVRSASR